LSDLIGNPHVITSIAITSCVLDLLKILPETDIVMKSQEMLSMQMTILIDKCEQGLIKDDDLYQIVQESAAIKEEAQKLYAANKK
jgi:hypothetical protein